jgi:hypothetical protein
MKRITQRFSDWLIGAGVGLAALSIFAFVPNLRGQTTPRTADGHPDLSGRYVLAGGNPAQPSPAFKPEAKAKYLTPMPKGVCAAGGTPTSITFQATDHGSIQLLSKPGALWILTEFPQSIRWVPTDGRPHSKDPDTSFAGESYGRWEGDTLVVDTVGIDRRMRNIFSAANAWTHTEDEHVVEHFSRPSKDSLTYQVTIEDPMVLAKPFTSVPMRWTLVQGADDHWKPRVPIAGCDF